MIFLFFNLKFIWDIGVGFKVYERINEFCISYSRFVLLLFSVCLRRSF